jgi:hypothetical protein
LRSRLRYCVWFSVPQATEWQRIGNQIDAALVAARSHFVRVHFRQIAESSHLVVVSSPDLAREHKGAPIASNSPDNLSNVFSRFACWAAVLLSVLSIFLPGHCFRLFAFALLSSDLISFHESLNISRKCSTEIARYTTLSPPCKLPV